MDQIHIKIKDYSEKILELQKIVSDNQNLKNKSQSEINQIKRLKELYELKLNLLTKDSEIKRYLNQLLNKDISKEHISEIVQNKIKEETEFLRQLEDFEQNHDPSVESLGEFQNTG